MGRYFDQRLRVIAGRHPIVKEVRGAGLIWGLELTRDAGPVVPAALERRVIVNRTAETVVRLVDPTLAIEHVPYEQAFGTGFEDIRCRVPDLTRVRQTIDYRPRHSLEDVVRDDHPLRHDPDKLAEVLMRVYEEQRRSRSTNGTVRAMR